MAEGVQTCDIMYCCDYTEGWCNVNLFYFLAFIFIFCLFLVIAQDCSRPVPGANMDLKDNAILLEKFPNGIEVAFVCNVGYRSAGGSAVITCSAGSWSPVTLRCESKY